MGESADGLDTIKIDKTGCVVCHRMKEIWRGDIIYQTWEVAALHLSPEEVTEVVAAVESNRLRELNKSYQDPNICDGTQWVLWLRQEDWEKSVYFNNKFPREITEFAQKLNAILKRAGLDKEVWQPVPPGENREHERELWDSIRR